MRILKTTFSLFLLLHFFLPGIGQTPESILDSINAGRKPEKLFTHFDKSFYQPGETIWFKTYITADGRPGYSSSVIKAELINENGNIFASQIIPVTVGSASGNLSIPSDLSYGAYLFRLYTQQMLNTATDNFYYKPILVLPSAGYFDNATPVTKISLQFFPEGGTFLANEINILAFSATDQQGNPANIKGMIKDSKGIDVVSFATENGMGKVELTPAKGEQYYAQYSLPSGVPGSVVLPAANDNGTNLLVVDEVLKKRLIVNSRYDGNEQQKPAYILGEMDQVMLFKIDISNAKGHFMGRVPMKDIPGGLLHIAVFNSDNKVLAERTCFVSSRNDTVEAALTALQSSVTKRGENRFEFMLPDSLEGTFSISVTDISQTHLPIPGDNIIAAVLVTSNLKGFANNLFYETGKLTGEEINDAVDLLLLTHEYKWTWQALEKLATVKLPAINESFIPLRGMAYADRNKKPLPGADLVFILHTKDSAVNSFVTRTDDKGYFEAPGLFYEDTALIYVKNNAEKNRDKKVELELLSSPVTETYKLPVQTTTVAAQLPVFLKLNEQLKSKPVSTARADIEPDTSYKLLEELVVTSKVKNKTEQLEKQYTKGLFSGSARTTIDFINNKPTYSGGNIFDYLKGRYSYLKVMGSFTNYSLVYRNMFSLGSGEYIPMTLYLDEMQTDAFVLTGVSMNDIALVRIYGSGIMGVGGALAVYTKKGQGGTNNSVYEFTNKFRLPGFSKSDTFYSPDYSSATKVRIKNDNRKTIYWNPSLTYIPEDGKVPVSFYNNDDCKEYKIVLQGFTTNGKLVYFEKIIR